MLQTRTVTCGLDDADIERQVTKGCPQGGVLSPLLWNVLVDELIREMSTTNIFCQFHADDGTLLFRSTSLKRLGTSMLKGLKVVEKCRSNMSVNPSKTTMVVFYHKRNLAGFTAPSIFGEHLQLSDSVKYLGLTPEKKLLWTKHVEDRCARATGALFQCRRAVGSVWGLRPSQ